LEGDGAQFDCQTCEVANRLEDLDPDNRQAWHLFGQTVTRLCVDVPGLVAPFIAKVISELDADDAMDLLARLSIIYDKVLPPKPTSS
jgi:hypothetical protein